MRALPYDRSNTSMAPFVMCNLCDHEYNDPFERRHYSQTNSCHDCGLTISSSHKSATRIDLPDALDIIIQAWREGKTVAIKGIGGYLLTCDAANEGAIVRLRAKKHRPSKPFALMYPDIQTITEEMIVSEVELAALQSTTHPIVLLRSNPYSRKSICVNTIAPGLTRMGIMLPYTPLFQLLMDKYGLPVVATSGNVSNAPIVFNRHNADELLEAVADMVIHDDRDIETPQDDSVMAFSPFNQQQIIIRRSRGLAPAYIPEENQFRAVNALATGAMLKSAFAVAQSGVINISQYLGDLDNYDAEVSYEHALNHMVSLVDASPELIITDLHPDYPSTRMGLKLAGKWGIPVETVQHHKAHFAAILGEHWQALSKRNVLGVIWDGTGLGEDGHIWGGEFFHFADYFVDRVGHLAYFPMPLGDKVAREPRLSAMMIGGSIKAYQKQLEAKFSEEEWKVYDVLRNQESRIKSSSIGRLFDAMASILGLADKQSYEGEAAMLLEDLACDYRIRTRPVSLDHYTIEILDEGTADYIPMLEEVASDLKAGTDKGHIALKFHVSLVELVRQYAHHTNLSAIAFSGGVFQNPLLVDLLIDRIGSTYELYFHNQLSPNDENIAFGQLTMNHIRSLRPK